MKINFCALQLVFAVFPLLSFSQDLNYSYLTVPQELKENANAVVRYEEKDILLENTDKMIISYKRVITVLNEEGNRLVGAFAFYDDDTRITQLQAVIYDTMGNEIKKVRNKDFKDQSAVDGATLYSESRVKFLDYTPVSYPYTIEFSYETKTPITVFIPSWSPLSRYFQSVQKSVYKITYAEGMDVRVKERHFNGFSIANKSTDGLVHYEATNLEALKPEYLALPINEFTPGVMVASTKFNAHGVHGSASNWQEFGKWMYDHLLQGRDHLDPETISRVQQLTAHLEDPVEKAKIVYKYIQDNTRYISVQVGIGGYQPIPASDVDRVKYGDCKGLTNYTMALLSAVGIESYYVHVEAGTEKIDMENDFASMNQGNHAILYIPNENDEIWLDCTSQVHPFGFVGDFTDDREVLVMTPEGGVIKRTPVYANETNHKHTKASIALNTEGTVNAEVSIISKGIEYDRRFYLEHSSEKDKIAFYKRDWHYLNNLHVSTVSLENNRDDISFKEHLNVQIDTYATSSGERLLLTPNFFNKETHVPQRYRNRISDFRIERGYWYEDEYTITLPPGYKIEALPEPVDIENKYGHYKMKLEVSGQTLHYYRDLLLKKGTYDKGDYDAYRKFKRTVAKTDNAKIVLIKTQ
ncbi:DUF3857 domain-containing protein [Ascidiimonas aurantiaca]|uniref:DUF3857 domain-containing protein n=1 Tax=Ascidiimonas aurantiaca TaxID=1685432 RepID=UPI0030EDA904